MLLRDCALLALADPQGAVNRAVQSWLGVGVTDRVYGLQLNYRW